MPRVTGGKRFRQALQSHAKQFRGQDVEVGWDERHEVLKALRHEYGAEGAEGQVTPETAFIRSAIAKARPEIRRILALAAARGRPAQGMREAGNALRSAIRASIDEHELKQTGALRKKIKVREARP